jgi:hypothetical protein
VEKETRERTPAIYPGNYDASMDVVEIIPNLPEQVETEMQSWILGDRITLIKDTSERYFLIPSCLNPEQVYMTFNEYMGGDKGQDLRNFDRGFFKAVNHVIEVGMDDFRRNRVIRDL